MLPPCLALVVMEAEKNRFSRGERAEWQCSAGWSTERGSRPIVNILVMDRTREKTEGRISNRRRVLSMSFKSDGCNDQTQS